MTELIPDCGCNTSACDYVGHIGKVKLVEVYGNGLTKALKFNYCDNGIKEDASRGFLIRLL